MPILAPPMSLFVRDNPSSSPPFSNPPVSVPPATSSSSAGLGNSTSSMVVLGIVFAVLMAFLVAIAILWRHLKTHSAAMQELVQAEKLKMANTPKVWEVWTAPREPCYIQTKWKSIQPLWVQGPASLFSHLHSSADVVNENVATHARQRRCWLATHRPHVVAQTKRPTTIPPDPDTSELTVEVAVLISMPSPDRRNDRAGSRLSTGRSVLGDEKEDQKELGEHMIGITYTPCRETGSPDFA